MNDRMKDHPLSYSQEGLWNGVRRAAWGDFLLPLLLHWQGPLDPALLLESIRRIQERHEMLRIRLEEDAAGVRQIVFCGDIPQLPVREAADGFAPHVADTLEELASRFSPRSLWGAVLLRRSAAEHMLVMAFHPLIADRRSLAVLAREIVAACTAGGGPAAGMEEPAVPFSAFSRWQRRLSDEELEPLLFYWRRKLARDPLFSAWPESPAAEGAFVRHSFTVPVGLARRVEEAAARLECQEKEVWLALLAGVTRRYGGSDETVIGWSAENRPQARMTGIVGPLANRLPLHLFVQSETPLPRAASETRRVWRDAQRHQALPVERLRPSGLSLALNWSWEEAETLPPAPPGLTVTPVEYGPGWWAGAVSLLMVQAGETLTGHLSCRGAVLSPAAVERFCGHLLELAENWTAQPERPLGAVPMVTAAEQQRLEEWNTTEAAYPREADMLSLFREQVERTPEAVALVCADRERTYRWLADRCAAVARSLGAAGLRPGEPVAVVMDHEEDLPAALLGVWQAGGAYLPIDPGYPDQRIAFMLRDSGCRLALTSTTHRGRASALAEVREIDVSAAECAGLPAPPPPAPDAPAYIIYTSGTTGRPKGCLITQRNLVRLFRNSAHPFSFGTDDVWVLAHSHCFDFSVWEMYGALVNGGRLVIPPRETVRDVPRFLDFLQRHGVTVLNQTPTAFYRLIAAEERSPQPLLPCLRWVVFGGERLEPHYLARWIERHDPALVRLVNMYGITETTVHVTFRLLTRADISAVAAGSPIGRPLPETEVHVLNEYGQLAPLGVKGEIHVGGSGVGRGYLNRPELTAERFRRDPRRPGRVLYRSGDAGRWTENGEIEFLGRLDQQVKIRGFRVELGEIESCLAAHPAVAEAVVLARGENGDETYLCAYVRPRGGLSDEDLRLHLSGHLPEYMIPAFIVFMEHLPLTVNGKVDRRALPDPHTVAAARCYSAPRDEIERGLVEIWADVLRLDGERIGIDADFFSLGGHSLRAAAMAARVEERFAVKLSLFDVFSTPTIRALAERLRGGAAAADSLTAAEPAPFHPLTSGQQRLFLLQQIDPDSMAYNIPLALRVSGPLEVARVEAVLRALVRRHEILRSSVELRQGRPVLIVHEDADFGLQRLPLASLPELWRSFVQPFDLTRAPLLRAAVACGRPDEFLLLLDLHHLVCDGVSLAVLAAEFSALYRGLELPPLRIQYKDYAVWQARRLEFGGMAEAEAFWLHHLGRDLPVLQLPCDFPRPGVQSFHGDVVHTVIPEQAARLVRQCARENDATMFMVLLAVYVVLLWRWSGQDEVVVGTPVAGRLHPDVQRLVGLFVNSLALRLRLRKDGSFRDLLAEVREIVRLALLHQEYPFAELVEKTVTARDVSRNPLFDVMFAMQTVEDQAVPLDSLQFAVMPFNLHVSKFDLTLTVHEREGELVCEWEYATALFRRETVQTLAGHFQRLLQAALQSPARAVQDIPWLSPEETERVLRGFQPAPQEYPADRTVHALFEERAQAQPNARAVFHDGRQISYGELSRRSGRLAQRLRHAGAAPGVLVALLLHRGIDRVIAMLAVWKSGAAFLPLDVESPVERQQRILRDSSARLLLVDGPPPAGMAFSGTVVEMNHDDEGEGEIPTAVPGAADAPAYVLYTSGSTGLPKGVVVEHRHLVNILTWFIGRYGLTADWHVLQMTDYIFDPCLEQTFATLLAGGTVVVPESSDFADPATFARFLRVHGIRMVDLVPSLARELLVAPQGETGVEVVICGGEELPLKVRDGLRQRGYRVFNHYGPTETTIDALSTECGDGPVVLGRPVGNTRVYILDAQRQPLPVGIPGDLWVAGASVARGYLNRPELTGQAFAADILRPDERMYHTGDRGRWLPDGTIEFLGRLDNQLKVRGMRIEAGEIESLLLALPAVQEAVVTPCSDSGERGALCVYYAAEPPLEPEALRLHLRRFLPEPLLPKMFFPLPRLPRLSGGKIDRRALPLPTIQEIADDSAAPMGETEKELAEIWGYVLGRATVGRDDNFFVLGGHSLKAMNVATAVFCRFGVQLPLSLLFTAATIRELAVHIVLSLQATEPAVADVVDTPYFPLTVGQRQIWPDPHTPPHGEEYAVSAVIPLAGSDGFLLQNALESVLQRYECLCCGFEVASGEILQFVQPKLQVPLLVVDLRRSPPGGRDAARQTVLVEEIARPFDLSRPPLLRALLLRLEEEYNEMVLIGHGLIADDWTMALVKHDFMECYQALGGGVLWDPAPLSRQIRGAAAWERRLMSDPARREADRRFWLPRLAALPSRPVVFSGPGRILWRRLDEGLERQMTLAAQGYGVELSTLMLAAFLCWQEEFHRGRPAAVTLIDCGRTLPGMSLAGGAFTRSLPFVTALDEGETAAEWLPRLQEEVRETMAHLNYPVERIARETGGGMHAPAAVFRFSSLREGQPGALPRMLGDWYEPLPPWGSWAAALQVLATENGLICHWRYRPVFAAAVDFDAAVGGYEELLRRLATDPRSRGVDLPAAVAWPTEGVAGEPPAARVGSDRDRVCNG